MICLFFILVYKITNANADFLRLTDFFNRHAIKNVSSNKESIVVNIVVDDLS